jgi:hypothetical protein
MLFGLSTVVRDGAAGPSTFSGLVVAGFANVILTATAALIALTLALSADAAGGQEGEERTGEATAPRDAGEPITAIVSIKSQQLTIYDADGWILRAPVSSGVTGRETPAGVFAIVEKDKDHHSSLYDDAWMPHMQRITWSGIALHGGPLPGYAASHGCIRLPYAFAEKLFDKTRIGLRVIISPIDAEPVDFSDPSLFGPNPEAIAVAPAKAEALAKEAAEADASAKDAKTAAAAAPRAAMTAALMQRQIESQKAAADTQLVVADKVLTAAKSDQAKTQDAEQHAAAKVEELASKLDAAKADATAKQDAIKALPAKAEALAKEAAKAEAIAEGAKIAAAAAPRAAMTAALTQRQIESQKAAADAELVLADKVLAAAKSDQAKALDAEQHVAAKVEELASKLDAAKADAEAKQDAIKALPAKAETLAKEAANAEAIAEGAKTAAVGAPRAAMTAVLTQRQLESQKAAADAQLVLVDKGLAAAKGDQAKAQDAQQHAAAKVEELASKLDAAKADAKVKQDAIKALQDASSAADANRTASAKAAREAKLALEPVSVFISRATQKLYVRRDTHSRAPDGGETFDTILEIPVTIRDPGKPIGTHVFTAVARTEAGGLRWTAVTIDGGDIAKNALYRVTIPQDVLDRIAPTAMPRSSIVISDEPLNRETNYHTEFVVVLNNQPQGGLAMRERSDETRRNNAAQHLQAPPQRQARPNFFEQLFGIARPASTYYRPAN